MAITQVGAAPAHSLLILGIHWMEAIMRTSITRLIIAAAVATVVASGTPVARSLAAPPVPQESLPNRYEPPFLRRTFISVIINSLEAISSTDRATA